MEDFLYRRELPDGDTRKYPRELVFVLDRPGGATPSASGADRSEGDGHSGQRPCSSTGSGWATCRYSAGSCSPACFRDQHPIEVVTDRDGRIGTLQHVSRRLRPVRTAFIVALGPRPPFYDHRIHHTLRRCPRPAPNDAMPGASRPPRVGAGLRKPSPSCRQRVSGVAQFSLRLASRPGGDRRCAITATVATPPSTAIRHSCDNSSIHHSTQSLPNAGGLPRARCRTGYPANDGIPARPFGV